MAYLDDILSQSQQLANAQQQQQLRLTGSSGLASASVFPINEVAVPAYQTPTPYLLANLGYRTNELAYTCITERAARVAEAPLRLYDMAGDEPQQLDDHPLRKLIKRPNRWTSEKEFWKIVITYLLIAGTSAWEKERNNAGDVIARWPMRPDFCTYLRGPQEPLRAIRYQPFGLQPFDIPIENIVLFQYFDPIYPQLKGLSPTAVALEILNSDNNMTDMVNNYIQNGAFLGGVLKTDQIIGEAEAQRIQDRWGTQHGGKDVAGKIAVFGKGVEFSATSQTFRDMVFPEVDARAESRICMIYRISPITIAAKVGIGVATYNNYKEARAANYESVTTDDWNYLQSVIEHQLLPEFMPGKNLEVADTGTLEAQFDTSEVKALQEDQTARVDRAVKMYQGRVGQLNEARKLASLKPDPNPEGDGYYIQPPRITVGNEAITPQGEIEGSGDVPTVEAGAGTTGSSAAKPVGKPTPPIGKPKLTQVQMDAISDENKKFRAFAKRRIKEGKIAEIADYEFKYLSADEQKAAIDQFMAIGLAGMFNKSA